MKSTFALLAVLLALTALPANAAKSRHDIYNNSRTCAWMTLDTASPISGWKNREAKYLRPGEHVYFVIDMTTELKIRAQPTRNADCSGGQIADLDIVEKSPWNKLGSSETTLYHTANGGFALKWGKL